MNNLRTKNKKTSRNRIRKNVKKLKQPSETSSSSGHLSSKLEEQIEKLRIELNNEKNEKEKYKINLKKLFFEKQELMEILKKCQSERDTFKFDLDTLKQIHIKELRRSKAELEALSKEYCQIMSERDNVHKEIEALQEKLNKSQDKVKLLNHTNSFNNTDLNSTRHSNLNTTILDDLQLDTVKRQLKIVTQQRDEAQLQIDELKKKFGITEIKPRNSILSESTPMYEDLNDEIIYKKEINSLVKELDLCKKRRDIAFIERDKVLRERESIRALCDELRHQRDKSISELADSLRENDDLKKEKSMAFKQIQMLENKLNYYEDKLITYREEEIKRAEKKEEVKVKRPDGHTNLSKSIQNVTNNDSKMSKSEDNHRILKIEIDLEENPELGVEFSYATYEFDDDDELKEFQIKNQSNNLIIVNSVDPESISYGKLKENDQILKINQHDLRDIELDDLEEIIKNLSGTVEFIVSRYFAKGIGNELESNNSQEYSTLPSMSSLSSFNSNQCQRDQVSRLVHSKKSRSSEKVDADSIDYVSYLTNKQSRNITLELEDLSDLILETGIFICGFERDKAIEFGFKNISVGDRIVSINGNILKNKNLADLMKILREKSSNKIKLLIEKVSNLTNYYISPSSSMLSLNLDLNNLKFRSNVNKPDENSYVSSNSLTSSVVISEKNLKKDNLKSERIRPLYSERDFITNRPESRLFDKIVNGSLRYEDLISNLQNETSKNTKGQKDQEPEIIKKIYL